VLKTSELFVQVKKENVKDLQSLCISLILFSIESSLDLWHKEVTLLNLMEQVEKVYTAPNSEMKTSSLLTLSLSYSQWQMLERTLMGVNFSLPLLRLHISMENILYLGVLNLGMKSYVKWSVYKPTQTINQNNRSKLQNVDN
jgi:hypothetical protein